MTSDLLAILPRKNPVERITSIIPFHVVPTLLPTTFTNLQEWKNFMRRLMQKLLNERRQTNVESPGNFEVHFMEVLKEGAAVRIDRLGNKVEIPPGYTFKEGPDGFGVAIAPCARAMVDKVGRIHSVPKGYVLRFGKNGKGLVVPQGDPTRETKEGQIELLRRIKKP